MKADRGMLCDTVPVATALHNFGNRKAVPMHTPAGSLYILFPVLLQSLLGPIHAATLQAAACLVFALLNSQSLHPADVSRCLPQASSKLARQGFKRVRRALQRSQLGSNFLTPLLLPAALGLVSDHEVRVVLDSTRCLFWEIFTLGLAFHGRVLPVAWAILPYPWPKNAFTPTVVGFLQRFLQCWPQDRPLHMLADRAFPSLKLFALLQRSAQRLSLGYTIRLRASDWVRLADGQAIKVGDLEATIAVGDWRTWQVSYQHAGKAGPQTLLVIGRGEPTYPAHQQGPADCARRQAREKRRIAHLLSKKQPQAPDTDRVWALLTTESLVSEAIRQYALRFSTEGTYRDLKSWGLEAVAGHEKDARHLDGLMGLAILSYLVQAAVGWKAGRTDNAQARARQRQWTTTDRISLFWRGRQVLHDPAWDWRPWLSVTLHELTEELHSYSQPAKRVRSLIKEAA